jgi:hypothetical protein
LCLYSSTLSASQGLRTCSGEWEDVCGVMNCICRGGMLLCHNSMFHSPYLFYLVTAGVEVDYFHLITTQTPLDSPGRGIGPSQRPLPENTNTHKRQTSMPPVGIRTHDPSKCSAAELRLRPRGHWDRPKFHVLFRKSIHKGPLWDLFLSVAPQPNSGLDRHVH